MRTESKNILKKGVDVLKSLHFKPENIMVTGSIALDIAGVLPESRVPHDIDIILKTDEKSWRCLKLLEAICNDDESRNIYPNEKFIFFKGEDIIINIFLYDGGDWSDVKDADTGVYVATVDHIIKAKKKYARTKDYQDINEIAKTVLSL